MTAPRRAEALFESFFWPQYPPDVQSDYVAARAIDANPARNPRFSAHLDEAGALFAKNAERLFGTDLALDFSDASVHRLSAALIPERRDQWAATGSSGTPDNLLFNAVIHGSAYVGLCIVKNHGGEWCIRRPLWESVVRLRSRAGEGDLPIFHWWLKSLADTAPGEGLTLADRYRTQVEVPCSAVDALPVFISSPRPAPRLSKVTYSALFKYLKAHLPELKDVGADFPSAERFNDYKFRWLEFLILGEGRMVLLHGSNEAGHHLFWLDQSGFQKSAFYPCDSLPEPTVEIENDTLTVTATMSGGLKSHQMLWWGP